MFSYVSQRKQYDFIFEMCTFSVVVVIQIWTFQLMYMV